MIRIITLTRDVSCSETNTLMVSTSDVHLCMRSPVLFAPCQEYGSFNILAYSSSLIRFTNFSAAASLKKRKRKRNSAAIRAAAVTAAAMRKGNLLRSAIPPILSRHAKRDAGRSGALSAITLSTVKLIILGMIISSKDTMAAKAILSRKIPLLPLRK